MTRRVPAAVCRADRRPPRRARRRAADRAARSRRCGRSVRPTSRSPAGSGAIAWRRTATRTIPHGFQQLERRREPRQPPPGGRGARAVPRPSARRRASSSRSSTPTSTSGWRRPAGSSVGRRTRPWRGRRRGDRARRGGPAAGRLSQHATSRSSAAASYQDLAWGHELYCVGHLVQAAVAWHRALGDDRLLDGRGPRRRLRRARAGPGRPAGDRRPSRDRDGARRAVPDHRRATLPRPCARCDDRAARPRAARGRPVRRGVLAGSRAGPRRADRGRPRRAPAVPRLRRRRRRRGARRRAAARRRRPALARHGRDADVPDRRRSAAATATRRSATRSSCRRTGPTPRRAPRSPA